MKKSIALLLALMMLLCLPACGGNNDAAVSLDLAAIKAEMVKDVPVIDPIDMDSDYLLNYYGIQPEQVVTSQCFLVMDDIFPAEIIMIEATDEAARDVIADKLQIKLDSLKVQAQSYDPASYEIAKACTVMKDDNYVAMFFSKDGKALETIYRSHID